MAAAVAVPARSEWPLSLTTFASLMPLRQAAFFKIRDIEPGSSGVVETLP